jgi:hypothetical protein
MGAGSTFSNGCQSCICRKNIVFQSLTLSMSQLGRKFVKDDDLELCLPAMSRGIRVHMSPMVNFVGPTSNNTSRILSPFFVTVTSHDKRFVLSVWGKKGNNWNRLVFITGVG